MHFLSLDWHAERKGREGEACCQAYTHSSVFLSEEQLNYLALLLVPTGWNQELTAPDSATDAHNRLLLVFLSFHSTIAQFLICEVL